VISLRSRVTLDGVSQTCVTVTVSTTSPQLRFAGVIGGSPTSGAGRLIWLLLLLIAVLAIAILQSGRIRYSILECFVLMTLLSIGGCGGGNTSRGTPARRIVSRRFSFLRNRFRSDKS
jgi:hypothetical protein